MTAAMFPFSRSIRGEHCRCHRIRPFRMIFGEKHGNRRFDSYFVIAARNLIRKTADQDLRGQLEMAPEASGIAILGWGSLLWDSHAAFDEMRGQWHSDGPALCLEFSRISSRRLGALTLVIDPDHGQKTIVSYCLSKRENLDDAIADLRCREETSLRNIGFIQNGSDHRRYRDGDSWIAISSWAKQKQFHCVVWTDLNSNFKDVCGKPFSVNAAISYIQLLEPAAKAKAAEYVWRAPAFVHTDLRDALEVEPWFQRAKSITRSPM